MRVLAVGAHPDDIEYLCAGTLARCVYRGDQVFMAVVTDGSCGTATLSREEIAGIREKESRAAAELLGAELIWMAFPDAAFFDKYEHRAAFVDLVRMVDPDFMIVNSPNDYHSDHVNAGKMASDATLFATAPAIRTEHPAIERMPKVFYMDTVAGFGFEPETYVDVTDTFELKKRMLLCHESQELWSRNQYNTSITEGMEALCRFRGLQCGVRYAEGFRQLETFARVGTARLLP